jgi:acetolactate decarboxylase
MLALDGNYYQIKTDGIAYPVSGETTTPFATVTYFEADENFRIEEPANLTELEAFLDLNLPSENLFYAVRVEGCPGRKNLILNLRMRYLPRLSLNLKT